MKPNDTNPREGNEPIESSVRIERANEVAEGENDWNMENATFVAAYNELIEAEGVALEEYRLF